MQQIIVTIIGASIANILTWSLYQGFIKSYWGKNIREEITRFFNKHTKHLTKGKKK